MKARQLFRASRVIHLATCRHNVWRMQWVAGNNFRSLDAQRAYADSQGCRGCKVCNPFEGLAA